MEKYSIVAQVWKLSTCDMCELVWNSVLNLFQLPVLSGVWPW